MTSTATTHIETVEGFAALGGTARCFKLEPPRVFDGFEFDYVTIAVYPPVGHQSASVASYPAVETGAAAPSYGNQLASRVGTYHVEGNPLTSPEHINGCFLLALQLMGYTPNSPEKPNAM